MTVEPLPLVGVPLQVGLKVDDEEPAARQHGRKGLARDDAPVGGARQIMTDPFVGTLTFCRIYSGILNAGDGVYNSVKGQRERVGRTRRGDEALVGRLEAIFLEQAWGVCRKLLVINLRRHVITNPEQI